MDFNKGRFIPNINPLSAFGDTTDARSPFDGEICIDDKNNIGYWVTDITGAWKFISRTQFFQEYLDKYESDTTFSASRAFNSNEIIRRLFYNKETLKCWLDSNNDVSIYDYYAIKSIRNVNGKQRYISGLEPHDGLDYSKALIPVNKVGDLVFEIFPNVWYSIEFYDKDKKYKASINYISYPSKIMPIEKNLRQDGVEDDIRNSHKRLIDVSVKFNQSLGKNKGFLYLNQPVSDLKCSIVKNMSGGYICNANPGKIFKKINISNDSDKDIILSSVLNYEPTVEDGNVFEFFSFDKINKITSEESSSTIIEKNKSIELYEVYTSEVEKNSRISLNGFENIDTTKVGTYDCNVIYSYIKTNNQTKSYNVEIFNTLVLDNDVKTFIIDKKGNNHNYESVQIKLGNSDFKNVDNFDVLEGDEEDYIIIPSEELGLGQVIVKILYTYINNSSLVNVDDLKLSIPVTIEVKEDDYPEIISFIPAGYITNPGRGLYNINLKFFALFDNGNLYDVTENTIVEQDINNSLFGTTQHCTVSISVDKLHLYKNTYSFTVFCEDPSIAGNNSRILINGNISPKVLVYDGYNFKLGKLTGNTYLLMTFQELIEEEPSIRINGIPTHVCVSEVEKSELQYTKITNDINDLVYIDRVSYDKKEINRNSYDITVGEIIDNSTYDPINNYNFIGYSIDGINIITNEERFRTIKKGESINIYRLYMKNQTIYSASKDKTFIIKGYRKDENGKYINTGAVISYAISV